MITPDSHCHSPVLVVDDDEDILQMTSFVLKQLGYSVATESDGSRAITALKDNHYLPCLILLDLMMPTMDGATFRKKLLEIPGASNVPVVILSGDSELAAKAAKLHVAGFEQKPISVERLASIAAKFCHPSN